MGGKRSRSRNRKHRRSQCRRHKHRRCRCRRNRKLHRQRRRSLRRHLKPIRPLLHRRSLRSRARMSLNTPTLHRHLVRRHHHLPYNSHILLRHRPWHHSLRRRKRILLPHHSQRHLKNRLVHPYTYSLLAISKARLCSRYQRTYLYYLGASEDKLATLPGLANALGLMKKGMPPVAMAPTPAQSSSQALPPPSSAPGPYMAHEPPASSQVSMASQPQQAPPPPSTAPSHYSLCKDDIPSSSQPAPQPPSSQPPSRKQPYRFDSGKHEGKPIAEVPPDYMAFLKSKGFTETNETLAAGVAEYERHHPPIGTPHKGEYKFTFGKHEGKTVAQVPQSYIWFIKNKTTIMKDKPEVGAAIRQFERTQKRTETKAQSRGRRRAWSPMCSCCD